MTTKRRVAVVLSLFALVAAGCGGDDEDDVGTIPTVPLSVPGGEASTTFEETETDTTVETVPEETSAPEATPTPTPTPTPPAETPDTPQNDTPPTGDAQRFEDFCSQNPGACE